MEPTPPADPRLRARRAALVVLVWSFFGILGGASHVTEQMKPRYAAMQIRAYPWPTELWLPTSDRLRSVPGIAVTLLTAVLAVLLVARGVADRRLGRWIFLLVAAELLLIVFVAFALWLPFVRISCGL